jgi:hypothetical protein
MFVRRQSRHPPVVLALERNHGVDDVDWRLSQRIPVPSLVALMETVQSASVKRCRIKQMQFGHGFKRHRLIHTKIIVVGEW